MEAQLLSPCSLKVRWVTVLPLKAFHNLKLKRADYAYRAVLRPFAYALTSCFRLMIAGAQPEGLLEVPVRSLGEVAHPAPATAPRAGRGGHYPPIPSSTVGP